MRKDDKVEDLKLGASLDVSGTNLTKLGGVECM